MVELVSDKQKALRPWSGEQGFRGKLAFRALCGRKDVLLAFFRYGETPILSRMCRSHTITKTATQNLPTTLQERCG